MRSVQVLQNFRDLLACKHDRQTGWPFSAFDTFEPADFLLQNFLVQKEQSAQRLILCRRRHFSIARQRSEKLSHFYFIHLARMTFAVEKNEAPNPIDVRLLSAKAVVFATQRIANAIE
jgi:hypothetical protein